MLQHVETVHVMYLIKGFIHLMKQTREQLQ